MKQAERRKFHYIYKITRNDGSGKYYIGMHSTDDLEDGYFGSGQLLWKSIKKYGKEMHAKQILEFLPSRQELKTRERELVNEEIVNDPRCMNLKLGGEGGGKFWSIEHQHAFQKAGTSARAKQIKEFGQHPNSLTNANANLTRCNWEGRCHSEETKIKIGMANSASQSGEKNSQFGTCWVTNGVAPIKIKKENLDEYLANGYRRGRKN